MRRSIIPLPPQNPDALIFSDLHLHERPEFAKMDPITGLNSRLIEGLDILDQIIYIVETTPTIKTVFFLGDVFELKDRVPNHIIVEFKRRLDLLVALNKNILFLMGNHDYNLPNYPLLEVFNKDVHFLSNPGTGDWCFSKKVVCWITYQRDTKAFLECLERANEQNPDYVLFHQEIPGVVYESGKKVSQSFPINSYLKSNITYISGHIHNPQKVGRVQYVGSPYPVKFSNIPTERYVWLLESEINNLYPVKLTYPDFFTFDLAEDFPTVLIKNNYIRVAGEVEKHNWTPEKKKQIKDFLIKGGAKGISFQVDLVQQSSIEIQKGVSISSDEDLVRNYVENGLEGIELNKEKLIDIGLEIFNNY